MPKQNKGLQLVLGLYRDVLRVHRERLPSQMRDLGDSYARAEFRAHLKGKTTLDQWKQFVQQWQHYATMLRGDAQATSVDKLQDTLDSLSADQRRRLEELKQEIQAQSKEQAGVNPAADGSTASQPNQ